jgi:hypothetical protein
MPLTEFQEELASMSLSELRLYLRKLRSDTFPPQNGQLMPKRRVLNDIQKLETINKSSAGLEAVKVARKTMRKPIEIETVKADDGLELKVPVPADPTFHIPSTVRKIAKARKPKAALPTPLEVIEEVKIDAPPVPAEKPKPKKTTPKSIPPTPAPAAPAAAEEPPNPFARYGKKVV